jgi:hypothetical protein
MHAYLQEVSRNLRVDVLRPKTIKTQLEDEGYSPKTQKTQLEDEGYSLKT